MPVKCGSVRRARSTASAQPRQCTPPSLNVARRSGPDRVSVLAVMVGSIPVKVVTSSLALCASCCFRPRLMRSGGGAPCFGRGCGGRGTSQGSFPRGSRDTSRSYGVAGFLDGTLELLGPQLALIVGDLDDSPSDVGIRVHNSGEAVQPLFDGRLAMAAAHIRHLERRVFHHLLPPLDFQEPLDGACEFFNLLVGVLALFDRLPDTVLDVVLEQDGADLLQGGDDARDLGQHVHAVGFFVNHALHTPHLTLDPLETIFEQLLVLGLDVAVGGLPRWVRVAPTCRVHHFLLQLDFHPAQPEGVANYRDRGDGHRHRRKDRIEEAVLPEHRPQDPWHAPVGEKRVEDPCGHRDQGHVVGERPEQVLLYVPHRGLAEIYRPRHPAHVPGDEGQVCRLHRHVGARAYGYTDVGLRQGRCVVDAVPDHAYPLALGPQPLDPGSLVFGPDLRHDAVYAELPRDGFGGAAIVAGQHRDLEPQRVQPLDCLPGLAAHHIPDPNEAHRLAVHRDEDRGLAFAPQLLAPGEEAVPGDARFGEKSAAADENFPALDAGAYPAT